MGRTHIILVPGFGGFDVLGQLYYYAGTGAALRDWNKTGKWQLSLHYFDSLPTAGVQSRAMALREYLQEHIYRRIVQGEDRIALVGHSTGGLDVRQLLMDLKNDCGADSPALVPDEKLLQRIKLLVFMSVPQRGTNIADHAREHRKLIQFGAKTAKEYLTVSHIFPGKRERPCAQDRVPDLFDAFYDAVSETREVGDKRTAQGRYQNALSRAARGELVGWLNNVGVDLFAIDDLAVRSTPDALPTPARYDERTRSEELSFWKDHAIRTLSFATVGKPPPKGVPTAQELSGLLRNMGKLRDFASESVYRFAYGLTAQGYFEVTADNPSIRVNGQERKIEASENDGIVNTASMLWPDGAATHVVQGDHGDIIGHYKGSGPIKQSEEVLKRTYHTYDLLDSNSGFTDETFMDVWSKVFDFCAND